jgi:hypothetical protein
MLIALLSPALRAQVETFDTIPDYTGTGITGFTGGTTALSQTLNNVLELNTVTYAITTTGTDNTSQTLAAYLVQWSGTDKPETTFTAPTTVGGNDSTVAESTSPISTFTIPPAGTGSWTTGNFSGGGTFNQYNITLTLNQLLDPNLTYAIVLEDQTNASGLGLIDVSPSDGTDAFPYGNAYSKYGVSTSSLAGLEGATGSFVGPSGSYGTGDYGFSQIAVVPEGNVVPVPEPRTAAVMLCGLFVAFLVGRQLYLSRKSQDGLAGASLA